MHLFHDVLLYYYFICTPGLAGLLWSMNIMWSETTIFNRYRFIGVSNLNGTWPSDNSVLLKVEIIWQTYRFIRMRNIALTHLATGYALIEIDLSCWYCEAFADEAFWLFDVNIVLTHFLFCFFFFFNSLNNREEPSNEMIWKNISFPLFVICIPQTVSILFKNKYKWKKQTYSNRINIF